MIKLQDLYLPETMVHRKRPHEQWSLAAMNMTEKWGYFKERYYVNDWYIIPALGTPLKWTVGMGDKPPLNDDIDITAWIQGTEKTYLQSGKVGLFSENKEWGYIFKFAIMSPYSELRKAMKEAKYE